MTLLGSGLFSGCTALTELPLPDDVVVRCTSCDVPFDVMTYTLPDSAEPFPLLSIALIEPSATLSPVSFTL